MRGAAFHIATWAALFVAGPGLVWLVVGFCLWDWNPATWGEGARVIAVILASPFTVALIVWGAS